MGELFTISITVFVDKSNSRRCLAGRKLVHHTLCQLWIRKSACWDHSHLQRDLDGHKLGAVTDLLCSMRLHLVLLCLWKSPPADGRHSVRCVHRDHHHRGIDCTIGQSRRGTP